MEVQKARQEMNEKHLQLYINSTTYIYHIKEYMETQINPPPLQQIYRPTNISNFAHKTKYFAAPW